MNGVDVIPATEFLRDLCKVALYAFLEKQKDAMERMNTSARAYDHIIKVAHTIAGLECPQLY